MLGPSAEYVYREQSTRYCFSSVDIIETSDQIRTVAVICVWNFKVVSLNRRIQAGLCTGLLVFD